MDALWSEAAATANANRPEASPATWVGIGRRSKLLSVLLVAAAVVLCRPAEAPAATATTAGDLSALEAADAYVVVAFGAIGLRVLSVAVIGLCRVIPVAALLGRLRQVHLSAAAKAAAIAPLGSAVPALRLIPAAKAATTTVVALHAGVVVASTKHTATCGCVRVEAAVILGRGARRPITGRVRHGVVSTGLSNSTAGKPC